MVEYTPKISVIIPVYNVESYLEECLDSIMNQTLKDIEIICVNDGSTDNSSYILTKYAEKYSNVVLIHQENKGAGAARNRAITIAKGEFAAFMDSDDYYPDNDILESLYNSAKENNVFICGGSMNFYKNGIVIKEMHGVAKDYLFNSDCIINYRDYQFMYGFTRFIYNLDFLKKNNLFFPIYKGEDPPFFVRVMICAQDFFAIKKVSYCYRVGYKKTEFTHIMVKDFSKWIIDILKISQEYQFVKLHNIMALHIVYDFYIPLIYKFIYEGNLDFEEIIDQIKRAIDVNLLSEETKEVMWNEFFLIPDKMENYIKNKKDELLKIINQNQNKNIVIYGAGIVGIEVADYLLKLSIEILCFAVSNKDNNLLSIYDIPVKSIYEITHLKNDVIVIIAAERETHKEIKSVLDQMCFNNITSIYARDLKLIQIIEAFKVETNRI